MPMRANIVGPLSVACRISIGITSRPHQRCFGAVGRVVAAGNCGLIILPSELSRPKFTTKPLACQCTRSRIPNRKILAMRIVLVGTGYVGLVSGACFADFGHHVTCVDKDEAKISSLTRGEIPIFEPDLERLVQSNASAVRLVLT